ncbi:MAG: type II toxin-antitoxin system VapC family toxin [Armatimonadota bacterium]|jgi:predicted nucleic acid-binding protein|nr:type II toxin-antitoxin system VapC family toxin [Armatimonadota bacterium]MDR7448741.1 type II toxin-antitoxin system VapC family toxin [Armatimonadota bacterium]MDR7460464.1 type II toxin-antitoxin system VapC family toxin [Armatimonadota bacterium]MDR7479079.1 type II toxin-antitoxin system VapC family toxin [Armatimonadota bacterium]MDR7488645.1 type II toxin-antitoxin system VapC family toxin [Armatimonadota bacterium]
MAEVCVDASLVLKLVLPETKSDVVREHWKAWQAEGTEPIAPWLWLFEAHAVLRRKVARGELLDMEAQDAWRTLRRQGIRTAHPRGLFDRAWAIAAVLGRPTTYDTVYLAVAELRGCELWTVDEQLARVAAGRFPQLRVV